MKSQIQSDSLVKESASVRFSKIASRFGVSFLAAIVTGLISGLLLRLIMKIIALAFPQMASGLTFMGTFMLVVVGIGFTLANSIIFTMIYSFLPKRWGRKGLLYGCINLVILGIPFFLSNPNNELFGPQAPLGIGLFSGLFIIGGFLLSFFVHRMTNWFSQTRGRMILTYIIFGLLIVPAIVVFGGIVYEIFTELIPAIRTNLM
ncbi:hypothetical protein [Neobacillus sp. Marseille-QA0830]